MVAVAIATIICRGHMVTGIFYDLNIRKCLYENR